MTDSFSCTNERREGNKKVNQFFDYLWYSFIEIMNGLIGAIAGVGLILLASLGRRQLFDAEVLPRADVVEHAEDGLHRERSQILARVGRGKDGVVGRSACESHVTVRWSRVWKRGVARSDVSQDSDEFVTKVMIQSRIHVTFNPIPNRNQINSPQLLSSQ